MTGELRVNRALGARQRIAQAVRRVKEPPAQRIARGAAAPIHSAPKIPPIISGAATPSAASVGVTMIADKNKELR